MKLNKLSLIALVGLTLTLESCNNFLEENPLDQKSSEQFWKTKADAESGVNALYYGGASYLHDTDLGGGWTPKATMWGGIVSGLYVDKRKDRTFTTASEGCNFNIESFNDVSSALWHELYKGISRANFVIANIPVMTDVLDNKTIDNYVAQGKFFRAYGYYWLVKEFGDVPYISEPYTSTENMYIERMPSQQIYENIERDLLDIIEGDALPDVPFYENGARVTKLMARTLLANVYLQWAGYPLNGGNQYYEKAAKMAEEVIKSGKCALVQSQGSLTGLNSAFNEIKNTKNSSEIIYAKEYNYTNFKNGNSYAYRSIGSDAFQWKDAKGNAIFHPAGDVMYNAYLPCKMLIDSYDYRDVRGMEKQFFFKEFEDKTGVTHSLNEVGNWFWFDENVLTSGHDGDLNMPIFRYSEVLLIAAEGYARVGNDNAARSYINQVRTRAGLDGLTCSGEQLVNAILTERLHEFPLEFKIWDDIRRTRLYPQASEKEGELNWISLSTALIQNKPDGSARVAAIPEYALLWPIPLSEIQANPALEGHQNPGWN